MEGNFYNNVLSRCDTIHDFTKARATKNMKKGFTVDNVYGYLDSVPALRRKDLVKTFKENYTNGNANILADFEQILTNNTPNFYFMKSYDNGFDDRRAGFEPAVVQFFEHTLGQKKDAPLEPLYLTSNKELMQNAFIDYTKPAPKDVHSVPGRVCILNLGNTGKDDEPADDDEDASSGPRREASGIFDDGQAYEQFQSDLVTFFASASAPRIRFVIDASIVGNQHFHAPNKGLEVAILACSQWDSASKFSDGVLVPESRFETHKGDPDGVLYALNSLSMRAETQFTTVNYNCEMNDTPIDQWNELPRQVGNIILSAQNVGKHGTNYRRILLESGDPVFQDRYGVLFDIKRSGDGCQVLEIKRLNQVSQYKYVLVTNDHLAFLKARMNNVPAVFTKKNTTTDTKTLVCVNNEVKNPEMYVMIIARHLVAEAEKMRELAASIGDVQEGMNQVILAFTATKSALVDAYFGEQMSDEYFRDQVVLKALFHPKAAPNPSDLTAVQQSDLEYVASRISVYILDFLSCLIDLKTRLVIVEQLFKRYVAIADEIDRMQIAAVLAEISETYSDPMQAAGAFYARVQQDGVEDMLQSLMKTLALLRSKAYGTDLYDWALDTNNIVAPFVDKLNELAAFASSGKSPAELVDLAVSKHFFMQDKSIPQMQEILNFKPLEAYTQIWRFLKKSYQTISMSAIRRRATRGSAQPAAESGGEGESDLVKATDKYLRTSHKMLRQTDPQLDDDIRATIERNMEAAKTFDDFYKLLIMEENVQNFSCRFYNAGLYDWQQIVGNAVERNNAVIEGGGRVSQQGNSTYRLGVKAYGMKVRGEGRYDQNKAALLMEQPGMIFERLYPADRTNVEVRAKRKEQWHAFMRYARPDDFSDEEEVRQQWSEWLTFNLEPGTYASEQEIVDNWSIFKHYKDLMAVEEALYEDAVEDFYANMNAFPAGTSLGTIRGHLRFEQQFDQGVLGLAVYENGNGSPVVRWSSDIAERFCTEYLDDMLFAGWGIPPDFVGMQPQLQQPQQDMNVDFLNRQEMSGGAKKEAMQNAMISFANDNVDAIVEAVVVLLGFLALNVVLHKDREPVTMKTLSFNVLCNTVFLLALLMIVKDANVHTLAFCVYVLALGVAVMVYLAQDR